MRPSIADFVRAIAYVHGAAAPLSVDIRGPEVAQLIHAHPTQNEALGEAHLALAGKPLHAHA